MKFKNSLPYCIDILPYLKDSVWSVDKAVVYCIKSKRGGHLIADAAFPSSSVIELALSCGTHFTFSCSGSLFPDLTEAAEKGLLKKESRVFENNHLVFAVYSDNKFVKVVSSAYTTKKLSDDTLCEDLPRVSRKHAALMLEEFSDQEWALFIPESKKCRLDSKERCRLMKNSLAGISQLNHQLIHLITKQILHSKLLTLVSDMKLMIYKNELLKI